jgi:hypothetical protein
MFVLSERRKHGRAAHPDFAADQRLRMCPMIDSGLEINEANTEEITEYVDELLATFRFADFRRCVEGRNVEMAGGSVSIRKFEPEIKMLGQKMIPTTEAEAADCLKLAFHLAGKEEFDNDALRLKIGFALAALETGGTTNILRSALIEAIKLTDENTEDVAGILVNVRAWLGPNAKWVFPG